MTALKLAVTVRSKKFRRSIIDSGLDICRIYVSLLPNLPNNLVRFSILDTFLLSNMFANTSLIIRVFIRHRHFRIKSKKNKTILHISKPRRT